MLDKRDFVDLFEELPFRRNLDELLKEALITYTNTLASKQKNIFRAGTPGTIPFSTAVTHHELTIHAIDISRTKLMELLKST